MGRLFEQGQIRELISTHAATSPESSEAYLRGDLKVEQFYPMGTWAEKVRAGAMGLGGVLVPVGVGILDQRNEGFHKPGLEGKFNAVPAQLAVRGIQPQRTELIEMIYCPVHLGYRGEQF